MIAHAFNLTDYFVIAVIVFSVFISLMRGFISEVVSLLTWIIAAIVAFRFSGVLSHSLMGMIHTPSIRLIVAFILLFIVILILGAVINRFFGAFVMRTGLSGPNRLLGMIFGFMRGVLLIALFILFAQMTSMTKTAWWKSSQLIPYFMGVANWLSQFIPVHFNHISHYFIHPKSGSE